jgi:hypothetical protein
LIFLQWPAIQQITLENRQHYREAIVFVESRTADTSPLVFAIGHAGRHFSYYAKNPLIVPETFADFKEQVGSGREVWCLVTAWLPELRPAHEPELLYIEDPQHQMIYDFVKANFQLSKQFRAIYPTYVYHWLSQPGTEYDNAKGYGNSL